MNDSSNESNHSSDCTCVFQKAFIEALEQLPQLWDPTDINFKNKRKRTEALENLLVLQRKSNTNATRDLVRRKVHWLISNYRRTLKQLEGAKENGEDFKPKWQFKALQFLHKREGSKDNSAKNDPDPSDEEYEYEYLDLPDDDLPSTTTDPIHTPNKRIKIDVDLNEEEDEEPSTFDISVDPIAYVWSEKLKSLDPTQRIFAEKAINDVLFEAQLNNLHRNSVQIIVD